MDLTKEYFDQVVKQLVTKEELENLATKDDLLQLATKQDVTELKELVLRIDRRTDEDTKAIIKDVANLKTHVSKLEHKIA